MVASRVKEFRRDFNELAYGKHIEHPQADQVWMKIVFDLVGENKRVLDIGCGDGTMGKCLLERRNELHGVDISQSAVEMANRNGIQARVVDIEDDNLPFADGFFDVVVAAEIIEHLYDTEGFLREINRVLKATGNLVLTTPNLASLGRRLFLLLGLNPVMEVSCSEGSAGHIRYFVKSTLSQLLTQAGFVKQAFFSDVVNFDSSGMHFSILMARVFPALAKTLIVKCARG